MSKVEIYTSPFCGYCFRAKALLRDKGVEFSEIDVTDTPGARDVMVRRAGGRTTVPQIFIDDQHVGGSDDLVALNRSGKLDQLLGLSENTAL